ncbi:MAG: hypothetical protein Q9Q40_14350, partial [Acidobacteriota bacterium]|nr:hypothetical protein [Acidobacteriota bacterium]
QPSTQDDKGTEGDGFDMFLGGETLGLEHEPKKRGKIRFRPGGREFEISLLDGADMSTFQHESAHFFLEVIRDLAGQEGADPGLRADLDALLEWSGLESADQITTEHHEQLARGWEAFLMEERAPGPQLVGVFARFQRWLVALYRELAGSMSRSPTRFGTS